MPRGRPRKNPLPEAAEKTGKDALENGTPGVPERPKRKRGRQKAPRVDPRVITPIEDVVPLSQQKVPMSEHGAYGKTTPEKAENIGSIIHSGIEGLRISTKREKDKKGDIEEIRKRTFEYLNRKAYEQRLPSIEGLAAWFGISRQSLHTWLNDERDRECYDFLNATREAFSAMWTEATQDGNINPVAWIFYAKNHYGYVDRQEVDVSAKNAGPEIQDEETIRRRWLMEGTEETDA